jgi:hypothetical protein
LTAVADGGRLVGKALYWNSAKTSFRLRGARGRAPCQHPSDSGRAGQSACEACLGLGNVRRFARVCPLIRYDSADGPRCSVAAAEVRPFWGRVVGGLAAALLGGAAVALVATYLICRGIGYRVKPSDLAWPPHWNRVELARADYFSRRGLAAYGRGDARGCYLALLEAHELRPGDFATDRLLAQVAETTDVALADRLFGQLVQSGNPARAANAAQEWAAALLARGEFERLGRLSAFMLRREAGDSAPAWTNALISAQPHVTGANLVAELLAQPGALAGPERTALTWSLQSESFPLSQQLMAAAKRSPSLYLRHYALHRLIQAGYAAPVLEVLAAETGLPVRETEALRLAAWTALGRTAEIRQEISRLLGAADLTPALAEMLAAQLIAHPDPVAGRLLLAAVQRRPLPLVAANYRVYAALLCVAGVDQDAAQLRALTAILGKISGRPFGRPYGVGELFLDRSGARPVSAALIALQPLSLEIMFAMLADFPRFPRAAAPQPQSERAR